VAAIPWIASAKTTHSTPRHRDSQTPRRDFGRREAVGGQGHRRDGHHAGGQHGYQGRRPRRWRRGDRLRQPQQRHANGALTIAIAGSPSTNETGKRATAGGIGSQAYAQDSALGSNDNDNAATATGGGIATAGGNLLGIGADSNDSHDTARASGAGSVADAGITGSNESGLRATAGPGEMVCNPQPRYLLKSRMAHSLSEQG
jgi:hypothetical protein